MAADSPAAPGLCLQALLCTVFDKDEGPMIWCSDPKDAIGEKFKPLGRYLLPETFVKGRVVSLILDDTVVLGTPVYIDDKFYARNCFQFNICMVINHRAEGIAHHDFAQQLAMAFHNLEIEIKLLSKPDRHAVQAILAEVRRQLNTSDQCFVRVGSSHCVSFRVRWWSPALASEELLLSEVPVPLVDLRWHLGRLKVFGQALDLPLDGSRAERSFEPDLTLLHMAQFIDGVRTVQDIIMASDLDEASGCTCLRHLIHFGLVQVISCIQLDSRFCLTPKFHCAFDSARLREEVLRYVRPGREDVNDALVANVQALYADIDGWKETLGEFCQKRSAELHELGISLRHFITFGLLRGFLTCINGESAELQTLRSITIPQRKEELKKQGMSNAQINKEPQIKKLVARMNELKAKEKNRSGVEMTSGSEDIGTSSFDGRFRASLRRDE